MIKPITVLGACAALVAGCASTNYAGVPAQAVAAKMRVVDSEFDKSQLFVAPDVSGRGDGGNSTHYTASLIASRDKASGEVVHLIRVDMDYFASAWTYFSRATLKGGRTLTTRVLDRRVSSCSAISSCSYIESIMVVIPGEFLRYHLDNPGFDLPVRIEGSRDSFVLTLSGDYIRGYLEGVRRFTGG